MSNKILGFAGLAVVFLSLINSVEAEQVPPWIQNTALWYGEGLISETEFLNSIKFLVDNNIIEIHQESYKDGAEITTATISIPNGNAGFGEAGFYSPLNLEISRQGLVEWVNNDSVPHTVQSIDENGKIIGLFNSAPLVTGEIFSYQFDEEGIYNYYCSLHPWRVGMVTVR